MAGGLLAACGAVAVAAGVSSLVVGPMTTWLETSALLAFGVGVIVCGALALTRWSLHVKRVVWALTCVAAVAGAIGMAASGRQERYELHLVNHTNQSLDIRVQFADGAKIDVRDLEPGTARTYRAATGAPCGEKVAVIGFGAGQVEECYASYPETYFGYVETMRLEGDDTVHISPATWLERLGLK